MKKILLFLISVLSVSAYAQTPPPWEWAKQGGSSNSETSVRCARDLNENVYVTGQFQGASTFGSTILTSNGGNDAFIAKYDSSGALLWIKQIGGSGNDVGYAITVDSNGTNFYVTGGYTGTVLFDATSVPSHGNQDVFIAKYDSSGVLQWVKHGGSASAAGQGLGITIDRSQQYIYATGSIGINSSFDAVNLSNPYSDIFLVKYNVSTGALQWAKKAGGPSDDCGVSLTTDRSGHIYLVGYCKSTATFDAIPVTSSGPDHSNFLAKYDSGGNAMWVTAAEGFNPTAGAGMWATGVAIDSAEATIYVFGQINGDTHYGSTILTSYGQADLSLASYDSSGALNWVKQFGGIGQEYTGAIALDKWSNVYATGSFSTTASFIDSSVTSAGGLDVFIAKFDPAGTLLWIEQAGGTGDDYGEGVCLNNEENIIYASGSFVGPATFGPFVQNGYGSKDAFVVKLAEPVNNLSVTTTNTNPPCNGGCNGTAIASPVNGIPPYTYLWSSSSATTQTVSGLCARNYSVTLTDSVGNTATAAVTINQPTPLTIAVNAVDASCSTCNDGYAWAVGGGGTPPYHYEWGTVPIQSTDTVYNLTPGSYYVCVDDSFACKTCSTVVVSYTVGIHSIQGEQAAFIIYPNPSNGKFIFSFQNALQKGAIEIFNSIGQQVYSEHFENLSARSINLNQSAGIYFVNVTDGEKVFTQKLIIQ